MSAIQNLVEFLRVRSVYGGPYLLVSCSGFGLALRAELAWDLSGLYPKDCLIGGTWLVLL